MKTKQIYYLLLITIFAFACKDKDESPAPVVVDTSEYFKCKVKGSEYTDDTRFADYFMGTARVLSYNNDELVKLVMDKDTTGTFTITSVNDENSIIYLDSFDNRYVSTNGSIIITELNKSKRIASGTFSGVLVNELNSNDKVIISEADDPPVKGITLNLSKIVSDDVTSNSKLKKKSKKKKID